MSSIKISWLRLNKNGQGYNIYRSDSEMDVENLPEVYATVDITVGEYVDDNVNYGETWYYMVSSIDAEGNEQFSNNIRAVCDVNIYGLTAASVLRKYAFDGDLQWENYATQGDLTSPSIDCDIHGDVVHNVSNSYNLTDKNGISVVNTSTGATSSSLGSFISALSDGRIILVHSSTTNSGSNRTWRVSTDKQWVDTIYSVSMAAHYIAITVQEENNWLVCRVNNSNNLSILNMTGPSSSIWSNTSFGIILCGTCDSAGFLTVATNTSLIGKFYVDIDNHSPNDPPMWQDTTTFAGETIREIHNDRHGNVIVAAQTGKVVKYSSGNSIIFDVNIGRQINDFRVQYDGNIIIATADSHLVRISGEDGSIMMEKEIEESLVKIAVDPGLAHIQRGSIIEF